MQTPDRHRLTDRPLRSSSMVTGTGVGVGGVTHNKD